MAYAHILDGQAVDFIYIETPGATSPFTAIASACVARCSTHASIDYRAHVTSTSDVTRLFHRPDAHYYCAIIIEKQVLRRFDRKASHTSISRDFRSVLALLQTSSTEP